MKSGQLPKKKKRESLLWQLGGVCLLLFSIMLIINALAIFRGQFEVVVQSVTGTSYNVAKKVEKIFLKYPAAPWMLDYIQKHPDTIDTTRSIYNQEISDEFVEKLFENGVASPHPEEIARSSSEKMKTECARYLYMMIQVEIDEAESVIPNTNIIVARGDGKGRMFVFFKGKSSSDNNASDSYKLFKYQKVNNSPVSQYLFDVPGAEPVDKDTYDIYNNRSSSISNGIVFSSIDRAITFDGEKVAVVNVEKAWTDMDVEELAQSIKNIELVNALLMISAGIALLFLQYIIAVRPLTFLQTNVRKYTGDKDAKAVVEHLSKINNNNEIGRLTSDMIDLAVEMDQYSKELITITAEKEKVEAELNVASQIQMSILPSTFPAFPNRDDFSLFASMAPAREVGGDLYDFFLLGEDELALVIGDVSGKGVPASLFMTITKTLIKNEIMRGGKNLAKIIFDVNNHLCEGNENAMFVTLWVGVLHISGGRLTYCNAGHDYPMVRKAGEEFMTIEQENNIPLGIMENMQFQCNEMELRRGDTMFLYTDGVEEAMNKDGEQFSERRMLATLNNDPNLEPEELSKVMTKAVDEFVREEEQFDDMTMLCLKLN